MSNENTEKQVSRGTTFWERWNKVERSIGIIAVAVVVVIAFAQVIARYVIGASIQWAEEVCKFGIIWMTFGGAAYAFYTGSNIGVTFLVDRLPHKIGRILAIIVQIVIIACFCLLLVYGIERTVYQVTSHTVAPASRLSMAIPYASIPVGSVLTIMRLSQQLVAMIKSEHSQTAPQEEDVAA